jgi:hypothetical protein
VFRFADARGRLNEQNVIARKGVQTFDHKAIMTEKIAQFRKSRKPGRDGAGREHGFDFEGRFGGEAFL